MDTDSGPVFLGSADDADDIAQAAAIAASCPGFSRDEDDECCFESGRSCFDCRGRRWVPGGFTCMRGLLQA